MVEYMTNNNIKLKTDPNLVVLVFVESFYLEQ